VKGQGTRATGFTDLSHLDRSFRRRLGCTPSGVRKLARPEGGA
jgi:AraC-like DNA-binding protein